MNREKIIGIVLVVLVIAGVSFYGISKKSTGVAGGAKAETVAKVNGVDITRSAYETQLAATITTLKGQGINTDDATTSDQIKTQVLEDVINNELVNQEIVKTGISVTPAEVETQYQALITQVGGIDSLKTQMSAANMTEAQVRENIAKQLTVQAYLLKNIDVSSITATEEEVKKFYDDNSKGQENVPEYKDVKDQISQQIILNKQQALINALLANLRSKATIEKSL